MWALLAGGIPALLVGLSIAPPTPTDIVMSALITPILFIPLLAAFWDSPGENRTGLEKCAEFSTVFLVVSGVTEVAWELPWVILEKVGVMNGAGPSDHAIWTWWSFGAADRRYITGSPVAFGVEFTAVICGIAMLVAFWLTRKAKTPNERLRGTWIAFAAVIGLAAVTVVYMVAEWHENWSDVYGGAWGVYLKFWAMGTPWLIALDGPARDAVSADRLLLHVRPRRVLERHDLDPSAGTGGGSRARNESCQPKPPTSCRNLRRSRPDLCDEPTSTNTDALRPPHVAVDQELGANVSSSRGLRANCARCRTSSATPCGDATRTPR